MKHILAAHGQQLDGEKVKFLVLAQTLRLIAEKGANIFYNGSVGEELTKDLLAKGGLMTMADLRNYTVSWGSEHVSFHLHDDRRAFTTPLPTSGALVALVLNVIRNLPGRDTLHFWHLAIEALKYAYGLSFNLADIERESNEDMLAIVQETYKKMMDLDFAVQIRDLICKNCLHRNLSRYGVRYRSSFQSSTGSICITSPNGDALVLTTDMLVRNKGKPFYSISTGIALNNQMYNFRPAVKKSKLPPSPNAFLRPGKRAFSSHSPVLVLNMRKAQVQLLISASGDETAPAHVIMALIEICLQRKSAFSASNSLVFYPDLFDEKVVLQFPMTSNHTYLDKLTNFLNKIGHEVVTLKTTLPLAVCNIILQKSFQPETEFTFLEEGGVEIVHSQNKLNIFFIFFIAAMSAIIIVVICIELAYKRKIVAKMSTVLVTDF